MNSFPRIVATALAVLPAFPAHAQTYAPPSPGTVRVTNACTEVKSIAIKNDENGQYQRLLGGSTDVQIQPRQTLTYPVSGRRFYAHFSGFPHLVGISTQFNADTERELELRQEGGHCVVRVAPPRAVAGPQPAAVTVRVTNMCEERKSIAIKNDDNGQYQRLEGERTDMEIAPSASRQVSLQGNRFYAHFSGYPHLTGISTQFSGQSELMLRREGGQCVIRAGSMAAKAEANAQKLLIRNVCTAPGSVAVKSNDSGDYQRIDGDRTDLSLKPGENRVVSVFGDNFWVHWSGRTDLGILAKGSGVVSMEPGGTPCKLSFAAGAGATQGSFRITRLTSTATDPKARAFHTAATTGRMIEIFTVPNATPTAEELAQIREFEAWVTQTRIAAAQRAIAEYDRWKAGVEQLKGSTGPNLGTLLDYGIKPPETFKQMALSGLPIATNDEGRQFAEAMERVSIVPVAALSATVAGGAIGSTAAGITSAIFPFAAQAGSTVAVGAAGAAGAAGVAVLAVLIAGFAIVDVVAIESYRPDLEKVLAAYRQSTFSVAAAARNDAGRRQLLTFLTYRDMTAAHGATPTLNMVNLGPVNAVGSAVAQAPKAAAPALTGLIKAADSPTVYLVDPTGAKRPIANPAVFNGCGLDWNAVKTHPATDVNAVPTGSPLQDPAACLGARLLGSVIKAADRPEVYLVTDKGLKRHIANPAVFNACKLDWNAVQTLPTFTVNTLVSGPVLSDGAACLKLRQAR